MPNPAPENLERYDRFLNELLSANGAAGYPLPPLTHEKGRWDHFLDQIRHWFDRHTEFNVPEASPGAIGVVTLLKWALIIAGTGALIWFLTILILRLYERRQRPSLRSAAQSPGEKFLGDLDSLMKKKIEEALNAKDFARAGRLRWKLFLNRLNQKLSLTPWEFDRGREEKSTKPPMPLSSYPLMFGGRSQNPEDYRSFDTSLQELEKAPIPYAT